MMVKKVITVALVLFGAALSARADEGMWMVNAISKALEARMQEKGLKLGANEIYNADAPGTALCDAVVALDFACTGSIISDRGLLITNHHCAYSDVHALSTTEHNYLEDGFWAMKDSEEKPVPGKSVLFLRKVLDVTGEVEALYAEYKLANKPLGMRKLSYLIEKKYTSLTGMEAYLSSMWKGAKYYLALYEVYHDIRLVAAPPVSIAAFGGDIDNWEWPQHKCDFAMYRVYTGPDGKPAGYSPDNIPLRPVKKLNISLKGYQEGDYTMVIGFPGSTDRYSSSAKINYKLAADLPVIGEVRGRQMEIISKWMNEDPAIRLRYADRYFSLSNFQEYNEGEELCYKRFDVFSEKKGIEDGLQKWIDADSVRKAKWGTLIPDLSAKYAAVQTARKNANYFRESIVRCSKLNLVAIRIGSLAGELERKGTSRKTPVKAADYEAFKTRIPDDYSQCCMAVEHDLFVYGVSTYLRNVDTCFWGAWHKELAQRFTSSDGVLDCESLAEWLWDNSILPHPDKLAQMASQMHTMDEYCNDPMCRFFHQAKITRYNDVISKLEGSPDINALEKEYVHAIYEMNEELGALQYPDANSTMRITYGTVGSLEPYDAVVCSYRSTPKGILEKENGNAYDFTLKPLQKELLQKADWGRWGSPMYVDFLTDNDITGGNSGSPVLNASGELIGLAFDGNKESLAGEASFTKNYNKCVCVDIRFVLWTLDCYAGMNRIIDEIL